MSVPTSYLTSTKNTAAIFDAIQRAGVPEKFSYEFLKQLGYASSGDRPMIPVLKSLGFLNDAATPTDRYRRYKDKSVAKTSLAQGIREAYADVFAIDTEAYRKSSSQLTGVFGRLSDKGDSISAKMALTFTALCSLADFTSGGATPTSERTNDQVLVEAASTETPHPVGSVGGLTLRHDVHVHLPLTTDVAVYDAIFKSLKSHLS